MSYVAPKYIGGTIRNSSPLTRYYRLGLDTYNRVQVHFIVKYNPASLPLSRIAADITDGSRSYKLTRPEKKKGLRVGCQAVDKQYFGQVGMP